MRSLWERQSELSFASVVFYCTGGLIALAVSFVFRDPGNPLNGASLVMAALAFFLAGVFAVSGKRVAVRPSLILMCLSATMVLLTVCITPYQTRAMNSGLLFYAILIYLMWFGSLRLARLFGYSWLAAYLAIIVARFGFDTGPYALTLACTSILLCELIGTYKVRLETTSLTDPLCGVWNKRGFELILNRAVKSARRTHEPLSVLYLDLDDLKAVNDSQGHYSGDLLLKGFAEDIERLTRPEDELARLGGDEFALLMPNTDDAQAEAAGVRLRQLVVSSSWSFGVAQLRQGETFQEFVSRADQLMLQDKRRRKAQRRAS